MKRQIRKGTFETNSSSTHSIVVMNRDNYLKWKKGELFARVKKESKCENTWGNFWSEMITLEFSDHRPTPEEKVEEIKRAGLQALESYKKQSEEGNGTGFEFNQKYYDDMKKLYENLTYEKCRKSFGLMEEGFWMTYKEFYDDYITNNDCYSPFEHDDPENGVFVLGKYYHS